MAVQGRLERECGRVALGGGGELVAGLQVVGHRGVERPDAGCVVGGTGCEVAHIWGEQDAGDVGAVCGEFAHRDDGGGVVALDHAPDVDIALVILISTFVLSLLAQFRLLRGAEEQGDEPTALFPAQTILPSEATVTDATLTSSSGISW